MAYRTSPCPHCGVIPDETPEPLAQVEKCLRDRVDDIIRDVLLQHRSGLIRNRAGTVFWYLPQQRWCRVVESELQPYGVDDPDDIPIEYPADDPADGMILVGARADELADWDPDDPRLPEGASVTHRHPWIRREGRTS